MRNNSINALFLTLILAGLLMVPLYAQNVSYQKLNEEINRLASGELMKYGQLSVSVRSVSTGTELIASNAVKNMAPASNLKLLTTGAALGILGGNYCFQTSVVQEGELRDSVLYGNIVVVGSGDPALGSDRFKGYPTFEELVERWAVKIRQLGINKITGTVIADASLFGYSSVPDNWPWGDLGNYYGAGVFGINVNENLYRLYFKGKQLGDSAQLQRVYPKPYMCTMVNDVKTGAAGTGDNAYVYTSPLSNFIYMNGTIPSGSSDFAVRGALPNPPMQLASLLCDALRSKKITIAKEPSVQWTLQKNRLQKTTVDTYYSPPIKDLVKQTNVNSINLYAESLLRTCGQKKYGEATTEAGIKAVQEFWKSKGLAIDGWFMQDGSGLSPNNSLSTSQMSKALYLISKDTIYKEFYYSLPIVGQSGTVYRLCKGTTAEGKLRAKSGTLDRVICYSGYAQTKGGKDVSFSVMTANYNGSKASMIAGLEKILVKIAELE